MKPRSDTEVLLRRRAFRSIRLAKSEDENLPPDNRQHGRRHGSSINIYCAV